MNKLRFYPESRFGGFSRVDGTVAFLVRVRAVLRPTDVVVDVGCGRGAYSEGQCKLKRWLHDFREVTQRVIGVDVDPAAEGNPYIDEFRLINDPGTLPLETGAADVVFSDYVLEHVTEPKNFFDEIWRVLSPGGLLCLRTPNSRGYVGVAARLIPNRLHASIVGAVQDKRAEQDVFPTVYRCNTPGALSRILRQRGFEAIVYTIEAEPSYMEFSAPLYWLFSYLHTLMPSFTRSTILVFAQRPRDDNMS